MKSKSERYADCIAAMDSACDEQKQAELIEREYARKEAMKSQAARFHDCIDFARAYGLTGTPMYQREAIKSLQSAISIIKGEL